MTTELIAEIEKYKREDGSYDVRRLEKDLGIKRSIDDTFATFFGGGEIVDEDPRVALAVEINGRLYDDKKAAEVIETQAALTRFLAGDSTNADKRLLVKRGLAIERYDDPDSNRPTAIRLKDYRDLDGNIYSDQAGIEEKPGRL